MKLFESVNDTRNLGVAYITLCHAYRSLGTQTVDYVSFEGSVLKQDALSKAENTANKAVDIFEKIVEPSMLLEAYNELGSTQREIAKITGDEKYTQVAKESFQKCLTLAEGKRAYDLYYVDTCDDLAHVCMLEKDFIEAKEWLMKAEAVIPEDYKKFSAPDGNPLDINSYWYLLGKFNSHMAMLK